MGIGLTINREVEYPLYRQIAQQVRAQIREGLLPVGTRLPPIRHLAQELGVTRPTVEAAYDELRADGWIETTVGRGTFVAKTAQPHEMIDMLGLNITASGVLEDMPRIDEISTVRSLAYAEPDPALFPMDEFWGALATLKHVGAELVRYVQPQGEPALRVELANMLRERGLELSPDDAIVTSGATQGVALVTQALCRQGDYVLVEEPTHICLINAVKSRGLQTLGVPIDENGLRLDILERLLVQYQPRVFYTVPTFHNPTSTVMSLAQRQALLALARRYNVIIVEDDVYGQIAYEDSPPPALKSLDTYDQVVYVSSVSKTLMNGIRLGYMVAPRTLHDHLLRLKRGSDVCTSPLIQRVILHFLRTGRYKAHLRRVLPIYQERRNVLLRALQAYMPPSVTWIPPRGGMSVWVTLPPSIDVHTLHRAMLRKGFAITPGSAFYANSQNLPCSHVRICYASQPPHVIEEAVQVLATLIREEIAAGSPPSYLPPYA